MIKLREKGFTLVEIMIVVAIIAILSAIAIPNFMAARSKSRANACKANLRQIDSAVEQYAMDKMATDGDSMAMTDLVPTYIKKTPDCQSTAAAGDYGLTDPWATAGATFEANRFEVGNTPWCNIGSGARAGGYPHILYY